MQVVAAVVLDLDGVLINSEPIWTSVREDFVAREGGVWLPHAQRPMVGMSTAEWALNMITELQVPLPPSKIGFRVVDAMCIHYGDHPPLVDGALESSGLGALIPISVSSEEVERGKPAPDVYLRAADRLGVAPGACVVIEDSHNGVLSALAADMRVIAIPDPDFPLERRLSDRVSASLTSIRELTVAIVDGVRAMQCAAHWPFRCLIRNSSIRREGGWMPMAPRWTLISEEKCMNALEQLSSAGQSIWLDFLRREMITSGYLDHLRRDDFVTGITSNPSIFNKAISHGSDYDEAIHALVATGEVKPSDIYYDLALEDVRTSSDVLRPVYERTAGKDGFVSFELDPALARDTPGSVASAEALVARIGRPNIMIKVPGTEEGVGAVQQLTALGVNVNITLLFSVQMYEKVAWAYVAGLEDRLRAGKPLAQIASVASFFVSRVDTVVDRQLPAGSASRGKVAIANSKIAYQRFQAIFSGERWQRLTAAGASPQRVLWASTGTKNPAYSDVLYVEELVGPETVNTMPEKTLDAVRDHGRIRPLAVTEGVEDASATISGLAVQGISLDGVTGQLLEDGLKTFTSDLAELLRVIEQKRLAVRAGRS